jgi:hypothetical protein
MSTEQIINSTSLGSKNHKVQSELDANENPKNKLKKRVDINTLMNKVREERKKESQHTLILFSLIVSLIGFFGVVLTF